MKRVRLIVLVCLLVLIGQVPCSALSETTLHSFNNADGGFPTSRLIYDSASQSFFGTANIGGTSNNGVVFQLKQDVSGKWNETVLYSFGGAVSSDCAGPDGGLTAVYKNGAISVLYGTCGFGGQNNEGVVFALTAQSGGLWTETVLFSFGSANDGALPLGGVALDKAGNLYGVTQGGGASFGGVIYQLKHTSGGWVLTVLSSLSPGANPEGRLIFDKAGNLYGTTVSDGTNFSGTVFRIAPPASGQTSWTYKVLHGFTGQNLDGANPRGALIMDGKGVLYGTTAFGGTAGLGTVFQLLPPTAARKTWKEKQLYRFKSVSDGADPIAGLTFGKGGVLLGVTFGGGANFGGTAFQLKLKSGKWSKTTLWQFGGSGDGSEPVAPLIVLGGFTYGTAQLGGANSQGIVYQLGP
jgi:uncharacterized repeat protein (TIGR03803 family)